MKFYIYLLLMFQVAFSQTFYSYKDLFSYQSQYLPHQRNGYTKQGFFQELNSSFYIFNTNNNLGKDSCFLGFNKNRNILQVEGDSNDSYRKWLEHGLIGSVGGMALGFTTSLLVKEKVNPGLHIGATLGAMGGFGVYKRKSNYPFSVPKMIIGSVLGGVTNYVFLREKDIFTLFGAVILPPIGASILIHL